MRNSRCKRNQRQQGGGLGGVVEFKADNLGRIVNNSLAWAKGGSCLDATASRPGILSGVPRLGLPGMAGGRRKMRKGRKGSRKGSRKNYKQSGGRYGFDPSAAAVLGGTPSTSGYAPVSAIPCEASRSVVPEGGASNTLNSRSSDLWTGPQLPKGMTGGGQQIITPDSASWGATHSQGPSGGAIGLEMSKAAYTQNAGAPIETAAGGRLMISAPDTKLYTSAACFKTGGGKASSRRRASRKNRKGSRKNRKGSRKH